MLPTVKIQTENGLVVINAADFIPDLHVLAEGETLPEPALPVVAPALASVAAVNPAPLDLDALKAQWLAEARPTIVAEVREMILAEFAAAAASEKPADSEAPPAPVVEPVAAADAPAVPVVAAVMKKGKKFIAIDAEGKPVVRGGIDAEGYATEQAAWDAVLALGN